MSKALVLAGAKVDGDVIRQEPGLYIAMGKAWQSTFPPKNSCQEDAEQFLRMIGNLKEHTDTVPRA